MPVKFVGDLSLTTVAACFFAPVWRTGSTFGGRNARHRPVFAALATAPAELYVATVRGHFHNHVTNRAAEFARIWALDRQTVRPTARPKS
jgi:hypothetical protein